MSEKEIKRVNEEKKNFKGYLTIFFGQSLSLLGSSIVQFAVIWYLTTETEDAFILSLATFSSLLPMILISPFAGVLSDRWDKKKNLITVDFIQAIATLGLMVIFILNINQIWHILILMAIRGACQGFQIPVNMSIVALMVPKEKISFMNSLNSILNSMIFIVSPALGTLAMQFFNIGQILLLDVVTFIPAVIILFFIFIPKIHSESQKNSELSFIGDFKEGINYLYENKLMSLIVLFALISTFINPLFSLLSLYIFDFHQGGAIQYGIIEIFFQIGIFGGSFIMMFHKNYKPKIRSVVINAVLLSAFMFIFAIIPSGNFILLNAGCLLIGIVISFIDVQIMSVFQIFIPIKLQGRVFSTIFTLIKSLLPIALLFWGWFAKTIGLRNVFIISPIISLLLAGVIVFKTQILHLDKILNTKNEDLKIKEKLRDISTAQDLND